MTSEETSHPGTRGSEQQVRGGKAPPILTFYNLTISTKAQLAKLMLYSLQKYKFQLCNCFRSRAERLYMYLVNVLILLMNFEKYENIFLRPKTQSETFRNFRHQHSLTIFQLAHQRSLAAGIYIILNLNICILVKLNLETLINC